MTTKIETGNENKATAIYNKGLEFIGCIDYWGNESFCSSCPCYRSGEKCSKEFGCRGTIRSSRRIFMNEDGLHIPMNSGVNYQENNISL